MEKPNFVPYLGNEKESIGSLTVTINKKGFILFNNAYIERFNADGKMIKFYLDREKKMLGWSLIEKVEGLENLKKTPGVRRINQCKKSRIAILGIKKMLECLEIEMKDYKKLPVQEMKDKMFGVVIHFVTVKDLT